MFGLPSIADWPRESVVERDSFVFIESATTQMSHYPPASSEYCRQQVTQHMSSAPDTPPEAVEFILSCLKWTPGERLTARQAIAHQYVFMFLFRYLV
jgi:hypothetical protein